MASFRVDHILNNQEEDDNPEDTEQGIEDLTAASQFQPTHIVDDRTSGK